MTEMQNGFEVKSWTHDQLGESFPSASDLGQILSALNESESKNGSVICEIFVNDVKMREEEEVKWSAAKIEEIRNLRVGTKKVEGLMIESLHGGIDFLDDIMGGLLRASDIFRNDDIHAAHKYYACCIEATEAFVELISHYKIVYTQVLGRGVLNWEKIELQLIKSLHEVLEAYGQKNYVLVADLLEYDLTNVLQQWRGELIKLESQGSGEQKSNP